MAVHHCIYVSAVLCSSLGAHKETMAGRAPLYNYIKGFTCTLIYFTVCPKLPIASA